MHVEVICSRVSSLNAGRDLMARSSQALSYSRHFFFVSVHRFITFTLIFKREICTFYIDQSNFSLISRPLYLEQHSAVLVGIRRLDVVGRTGVSATRGTHHDAFPWLPLQASGQAAAARAELLRLLKSRVLQDALGEGSP